MDQSAIAILDAMQDAVYLIDEQLQIVYWNERAECLYGWAIDHALGQQASLLLYDAENRQFDETLNIVQNTGRWIGEHRQVTMQGEEVIVESRWSMLDDGDILIVNTDITERKRLELQALRTQRLESLGTLAGGIAHDMNNILGPILVTVQLLKMRTSDEKSVQMLETLEASTQRGAELLKQVLSFARGVEGEQIVLEIPALIEEIQSLLASTFPPSIRFFFHIPEEIWNVRGDETQLHQVIMNLCVNARDALPDGGTIRVRARNVELESSHMLPNHATPGPYVKISVSDNGQGMTPEELDMAFEPFYTTKEQGTGLGLSTLLGIVKSHGGFIRVDSRPGEGSRFDVYLPAAGDTDPMQPLVASTYSHRGENRLILVVDDEELYRSSFEDVLTTLGYRVLTAGGGQEALSIYQERGEEIDLVLTDVMMPGMDGRALIDDLKKLDPSIYVVAMSGGYSESEWTASGSPADAFLAKPFDVDRLAGMLTWK